MKFDEIIRTIRMLAQSQGFYGRLLRSIEEAQEEDPDRYDQIVEHLEAQEFADAVDMVMFFET